MVTLCLSIYAVFCVYSTTSKVEKGKFTWLVYIICNMGESKKAHKSVRRTICVLRTNIPLCGGEYDSRDR
jgi:hypothetical protein